MSIYSRHQSLRDIKVFDTFSKILWETCHFNYITLLVFLRRNIYERIIYVFIRSTTFAGLTKMYIEDCIFSLPRLNWLYALPILKQAQKWPSRTSTTRSNWWRTTIKPAREMNFGKRSRRKESVVPTFNGPSSQVRYPFYRRLYIPRCSC